MLWCYYFSKSKYLRPILLLFLWSFSIFRRQLKTYINCLHQDAKPLVKWQLITYYVYKNLSLSYVFVSALSTSNILFIFYRVSCISLEIAYFRSSPESMSHHLVHASPPLFSRIRLTHTFSSTFRSFSHVLLSSLLYEFSVSSISVSFIRILSISQLAKRQCRNFSERAQKWETMTSIINT